MRVTRDSLIRIAKDSAQERGAGDQDIVAAYLTGSLAGEADPMIGGTADIDLVFVHASSPAQGREIVRLTPDFHLDISHRARAEFKSPRELRGDPWLGWEMFAPALMFEREKFFDFTQAAVRGGNDFESAAMTVQRCRKLLLHGRQIWADLSDIGAKAGPKDAAQYLKSLFHAGNAVAELNGPPIYERRFLLEFPERARQAGRPGMAAGMLGLLGAADTPDAEALNGWLAGWRSAFEAASAAEGVDPRIHPARLNYYEKGIRALLEGDMPEAGLWPLLNSWALTASVLPEDGLREWRGAFETLGLAGRAFGERVEGLDQYLDEVEILLDEVATTNGLETWRTG
ncbi:MAG: hypothetical protein ACM3QS_03615 [Bacteroidota bacterium]